jgi:hypothetical protein
MDDRVPVPYYCLGCLHKFLLGGCTSANWLCFVSCPRERAFRHLKQKMTSELEALDIAGILQRVNWLFHGAVCREWKAVYASIADLPLRSSSSCNNNKPVVCGSRTTLYSAAVASPATARLAGSCGLPVHEHYKVQVIARLHADMETLLTLCELGMLLSDTLVNAVASSGRLSIPQHLLTEQQCPNPPSLSEYAASSGSISMLKWLREQNGYAFSQRTCAGAAWGGHLAALQHLRSEGCVWDAEYIGRHAASSGSIEVVEWLRQQQGVEINASALVNAAGAGRTAMCAYLRSIGCDWHTDACAEAANLGHLDTLRWLRANGCPWDVAEVCFYAACHSTTDVLDYIAEQGELLSAEQLIHALNIAGANAGTRAAQWFREHGAQWPAVLGEYDDEH